MIGKLYFVRDGFLTPETPLDRGKCVAYDPVNSLVTLEWSNGYTQTVYLMGVKEL